MQFLPLFCPNISLADRDRQHDVLFKFRHIFSDTFDPHRPSKIPPMDLELKPNVKIPKDISSSSSRLTKTLTLPTCLNFHPSSTILIARQSKIKQFNSVPFIDPFTVISQDSNTLFISDLRTSGTIRRVHIKHVKPLAQDFVENIPQDSGFFDVEAILSHRSTSKGNPHQMERFR